MRTVSEPSRRGRCRFLRIMIVAVMHGMAVIISKINMNQQNESRIKKKPLVYLILYKALPPPPAPYFTNYLNTGCCLKMWPNPRVRQLSLTASNLDDP